MRWAWHPGWGLAVLRVMVGIVFLVHGFEKFFGRWGGGFADFLLEFGFPAPSLLAVVVAAVELLGGLLLIVGAFTRWVALVLFFEMLVAMMVVHLEHGFFVFRPYGEWGYEYHLVLLGALACLFLAGGGTLAVDDWGPRRRETAGAEP
jgi:putative oxidoreductase